MRSVEVEYRSGTAGPGEAYDRIRDFARYPELVDAVREVTVRPGPPGGPVESDWEVDFRNGVLAWSEEDVFDDGRLTIAFTQTDGDFEEFHGRWEVRAHGTGCLVRFTAEFDFGLPSLAGIIDPVAERVLCENIRLILDALLGPAPGEAAGGRVGRAA
ncbi:type II toxin-antitoxin system RatA family toxin [Streptomyces griseoflavus]|uniref:type II toxin-antitoxin system RatA family toxin n=1 Tax=Streptomyces griseoflavus TaxID=35619 RepID=UPI00167C859A|nr:SRPBCC family protein [Streptomyces griseoflavus]GGV28910.1 cyclase [Streptomyces griseoflavus]